MGMKDPDRASWKKYAPLILAAIVILVPLAAPSRYFLRTLVNIFFFASLGCAWNIIGGYAGQLSLGHAAFVALGAYPTALFLLNWNIPPWIGFIPGVVLALIVAYLLGRLVFQLRGPYLALATLAFAEIVRILLLHFREQTGGSLGVTIPFRGTSVWKLQFASEQPYYYICLGLLGFCLYVTQRIHHSRMGYYLQAIKENQAGVLGMRSLLTTTMPAMAKTITALKEAGLRGEVRVIVGGAPLTQQFADSIGADGFAPSAGEAVEVVKGLLGLA